MAALKSPKLQNENQANRNNVYGCQIITDKMMTININDHKFEYRSQLLEWAARNQWATWLLYSPWYRGQWSGYTLEALYIGGVIHWIQLQRLQILSFEINFLCLECLNILLCIGGVIHWRGYTLEGLYIGRVRHWRGYTLEGLNIGGVIHWTGYTLQGLYIGGFIYWREGLYIGGGCTLEGLHWLLSKSVRAVTKIKELRNNKKIN